MVPATARLGARWVIPPKANSAFVAAMEDVLAVYTRPRDGDCPLVCLDETSKQLIAETRVPISMKAGRPARFDYEYERNGTANLFMMFAPLEGWRHVKVTDRHTAVDYARVLKDLADIHFAQAKTIVLVQDNLSIHSKASLYEVFPAVEARRLVERFEWHYTPKHGSWLNLAESELGVLTSQCLDRRIPNKQLLIDEIAAWEHDRNANHTQADLKFTTKNARIKLKHLYPAISLNQATSTQVLFPEQAVPVTIETIAFSQYRRRGPLIYPVMERPVDRKFAHINRRRQRWDSRGHRSPREVARIGNSHLRVSRGVSAVIIGGRNAMFDIGCAHAGDEWVGAAGPFVSSRL